MRPRTQLTFKIATEPEEFEQIFRLNHRTFVEEIPQHDHDPEGRLVDRFHDQNTYVIAVDESRVVGMIAMRDQRPFSLDEKLGSVDDYIPNGRSLCELRLLAIEPEYRTGRVFAGLIELVVSLGLERGYDATVASGTVRQTRLYAHLGFKPFGSLVGSADAQYQPMCLTLEDFVDRGEAILTRRKRDEPVSLLPGPVAIAETVRAAFAAAPISHRAEVYHERRQRVEAALCRMTGARTASLFLGSGTLANDVVAAQISLLDAPGVVISNGEFGERLLDHAQRFDLDHAAWRLTWGAPIDPRVLGQFLDSRPNTRWLWFTACETSTGMANDIDAIARICAERGIAMCVDAVSAVGCVPVDLSLAHLATAASGKGLGSYPGIGIVLHDGTARSRPDRLPRYLDLGYHIECGGVPFTQSSNLLFALDAAIERFHARDVFADTRNLAEWIRPKLHASGMRMLLPDTLSSPAVISMEPPDSVSSRTLGDRLRDAGFLLSFESGYLLERNWIQLCIMGDTRRGDLVEFLAVLRRELRRPASSSMRSTRPTAILPRPTQTHRATR